VPQRLAIALQADGWIVRATIVWQKLAALPESCTDRPTRSHTTILMLARSETYYYDHVAIMEPTTGGAKPSDSSSGTKEAIPGSGNRANNSFHRAVGKVVSMRNCRDVWSFRAGRFPHAHAATFSPGLPERCILASTSEKGACAKCGAPWKRKTVQSAVGGNVRTDGSVAPDAIPPPETIGWDPNCACGVAETVPCIVLDPFAGSGTTLMVAKQLGRDYVGIEINEREYRPLIERRLREVVLRPPEKVAPTSLASRTRRA
jgi:DNA modification methylase